MMSLVLIFDSEMRCRFECMSNAQEAFTQFGQMACDGFQDAICTEEKHTAIPQVPSAGYKFGRYGNLITSIAPAVEVHVTTPLNHREATAPIQIPDIVDLTEGVHVGIYNTSTLSLGIAEPVTGPRPFDVEAFVQLNWRF